MFGRKKHSPSTPDFQNIPNTPPSVFTASSHSFTEVYGSAKVEAARWFLVALSAITLAIAALIGIVTILPLKEVRPWIVEINKDTGVVNRPVEVLMINPNQQVIKAELAKWVEAVYAIDPLRTSELLRWANGRAAEKAVGQFTEFRVRERIFERINREPNLVRQAHVTAVDTSQKGTAFIFVTTTERNSNAEPGAEGTKRYRVTLNFKFSPATQERDLLANPLGIFVTYFSDVEDRKL